MKFTNKELARMKDGLPPSNHDYEEVLTALSAECLELRQLVGELAKALHPFHAWGKNLQLIRQAHEAINKVETIHGDNNE